MTEREQILLFGETWHEPTEEEIRAECENIRRQWSPHEDYMRRRGLNVKGQPIMSYNVRRAMKVKP